MLLRRISFSRKHNSSSSAEKMPNGKAGDKASAPKANGKISSCRSGVGECSELGSDAPPTLSTTPTPRSPSPRDRKAGGNAKKGSVSSPPQTSSETKKNERKARRASHPTETDNQSGKKDGRKMRRSSNSSSSVTSSKGGIAHVRKTSRDCVIPEPIDLMGQMTITEVGNVKSPEFKVDDYEPFGNDSHRNKTRPITLQRIQDEEKDCISIRELSESPQRFGVGLGEMGGVGMGMGGGVSKDNFSPKSRLSVTSSHDSVDGDHVTFQPPSSPLLVAMRTAVDSLSQFDDFDIIEQIGAGFFAEVFKVRHKPTGQLMVLKKSKTKRVSLLKEVELLKRLKHPNILHYVGACIYGGQLNPLTEYVSGGTLEQLLQGPDELPWLRRLILSLDVSNGMQYLHEHGMFHRDLNSRNVLLRRHESKFTAVVADFGLAAKKISSSSFKKLKRSQSIVGTPFWMAPEVLNGKPYDESADVFSYGIVLCEVISRLSADPDDIPRSRDYGLNVKEFRNLPEVQRSQCPEEFMELAILACKLLPFERPVFKDITTRLCVIRELYPGNSIDMATLSQESLDDTDDTILAPQPPIRLSYRLRSQSPPPPPHPSSPPTVQAATPPLVQSIGFSVSQELPIQTTSRETRV